MNDNGFTKLETIIIISIISVFILLGFVIAISLTSTKKIETLKKETINIINISKNVYGNLEKENSEYIINAENSDTKGVCITLNGLKENDYLTNEYKNWDGYIVIEKDTNDKMIYTAWLTNGKYIIDGYTLNKISDLSLNDKTLKKGHKINISYDSFKGTDENKGGFPQIAQYNGQCIDEKIE